ncbi:MAG: FAD-dependent oxidoreductase [Deltaproteobacteria bacterium]|nr:FAD-dependent oxidoreductase [Deltaproteobacteria bacterium]
MKVAIVGAGIVGASAARAMARRGHEVTVYEQHGEGHAYGSSHGASRIVRRAYSDPFYTSVMLEAYPLWAALEADTSSTLVDEVGLLYVGKEDADTMVSLVRGLTDLGVKHALRTTRSQVPGGPAIVEGEVGVLTPEAGYVRADRALAASLFDAKAHGARVLHQRVEDLDSLSRENDVVLLCAGGWIGRFVDLPATVTVQTFAHLGGQSWSGPVWIEDGPLFHYGFPSVDSHAPKVGVHAPGPAIDADEIERRGDPSHVDAIASLATRRFGIAAPVVQDVGRCLYTTLPGEDFRIGRVRDGVFYASACSGHGFKTGPWVGRVLADLAEGEDPLAPFARIRHDIG